MARQHYEALFNHRPDVVQKAVYYGLQDFFKYLERQKKYLESKQPILTWEQAGVFIKLLPANTSSQPQWEKQLQKLLRSSSLDMTPKGNYESLEIWERYPQQGLLLLAVDPPKHLDLELWDRKNPDFVLVASYQPVREVQEISPVWVELQGSQSNNSFETDLAAFLHEETGEVYELELSQKTGKPLKKSYSQRNRIRVQSRNPEHQTLCLERLPNVPSLCIRPNTYVIDKQMQAIRMLQNSPKKEQIPLIRLFESNSHAQWSSFRPAQVSDWKVLTNPHRPGTKAQREFVEKALVTPDFMLLEGPPGSGKTTAILELILQLVAQGKRILLCASTHVAVDNVVERLKAPDATWGEQVLVVRIGNEGSVSEPIQPYCLEKMVQTEWKELQRDLEQLQPRSPSQDLMLAALQNSDGQEFVQQLWLNSAQVVCGTTIGILQHPDIKNRNISNPLFDVLILDEASKTPFSEFLVPALLAKRWVIVGDPKQLSPYIDDEELATNLATCLPNPGKETRQLAEEVAWRLARLYELRLLPELTQGEASESQENRYENWIRDHLPPDQGVLQSIETLKRVAFPSILESLQRGFGKGRGQRDGNALSDGLPTTALEQRHILIEFQHRMHPEISRFPRSRIYQDQALHDPEDLAQKRSWDYERYSSRAIWLDLEGQTTAHNDNQLEAEAVMGELRAFIHWAKEHPHPDGRPWTAAVLTFYRGQERILRQFLRQETKQVGGFRHFRWHSVEVELCTVDRFQGHEADLVLLSFVQTQKTGFLDSPNRLNVALTRARYQLVLVGKRQFFASDHHSAFLLRKLGEEVLGDCYYKTLFEPEQLEQRSFEELIVELTKLSDFSLHHVSLAGVYYRERSEEQYRELIEAISTCWQQRGMLYEAERIQCRAQLANEVAFPYPFAEVVMSQKTLPQALGDFLIQDLRSRL